MISPKLAVRTLTRAPFVTGVAVLSLGLGIGANAAIFSLLDQILLRSLPVPEPERLVSLTAPGPNPGSTSCNQAGGCDEIFTYPMFRDLESAETGFSGLAAHRLFGANLSADGATRSGSGMLVSGSYFPVLGLRPALGRLLDREDDRNPGEHYVAVLGHGYWERELGADPGVLNRTLVVNGNPMTIVGVAPRSFRGTTLGSEPDVYVPLSMREQIEPYFHGLDNRRSYWAYVFGRLAPGVSREQADERINAVYTSIINEVELPLQGELSEQMMARFRAKKVGLTPGNQGQSSLTGEARTPLILLISITAFVLLIACANIANLLLARGAGRGQEMAVRASMGGSRRHLMGQLLLESVMLGALGGVAGLLVARWTLGFIGTLLPEQTASIMELRIQPSIILFTAALALGTGLLFGMYPALHSTRSDLVTALKSAAGQPSGARAAARFRSGLVTAQIALSMALLVAAGLFLKSLLNVSRVDLGMDTDGVVVFGVSPMLNGYEPERTRELFLRMEEELAAVPGVTDVTAALVPLIAGSNWGSDVNVQGFERGPDTDANARYNEIGPGYFATMRVPLLAGREFTAGDALGAPPVAIVNEAFTRKFGLDSRDAVGKFMSSGGSDELDTEIVGIVQDAKYSEVKGQIPPLFFRPYRQSETIGWINFYVRAGLEPSQILAAIPNVVKRLDPNLPVEDLKTLDRQVRENVYFDRLISTLSGAFAVLATILAAVGLYGVLAYTVAQRTREIGLRMALGAGRDRVRAMVLGQVLRMTLLGGALGIGAALALGRGAQSLLFGLEGYDPWVVAIVGALLGAVALGAGYLPAMKASRVDPMVALRYE
jgi:predicted permease